MNDQKPKFEISKRGLYDLEKDPQQTTNLYREHSDVAAELSALLKQYARNPPTRRSAKAKAKN